MTHRRLALLAALAAAALLGAGCGEDTEPVPKGRPAARAGVPAIATLAAFELTRARLLLVGDLWGLHRGPEALRWLAAARSAYTPLSARVAAGDSRLDFETRAAFDRVEQRIRQNRSFDDVRDILGPLEGQLLDGAFTALGLRSAVRDPGVGAALADGLLASSQRAYGPDADSYQEAYGFFARAQSVIRPLAPSLGPAKPRVYDGLSKVRDDTFPEGVIEPKPPRPAPEYRAAIGKARAALRKHYHL